MKKLVILAACALAPLSLIAGPTTAVQSGVPVIENGKKVETINLTVTGMT